MELQPFDIPAHRSTEADVNVNLLHGHKNAKHVIQNEQPWHRMAALMFARGAVTQKEVAEAVGVTRETIRNLVRQPWFQETVTKLMADAGGRDIMAMFRAEQFNSLITLVEIRDNDKANASVRRTCAVDILDRALGKPVQRVETTDVPSSVDPVGEVRRLEEQNSRLRGAQGVAAVSGESETFSRASAVPAGIE